jgi:thiamine-phosphate diphosphorylase
VAATPGGSSRRILALTLCLITDRRRLAAACGIPSESALAALVSQVSGAIAAGVDVIQIREKDLGARDCLLLVRECAAVAQGTSTRIVVNDRLDVALVAPAHGIHLRAAGVTVETARRLTGHDLLVGRSVHSARSAELARTADYVIAGSVFVTASKPGATTASLGLQGLREVVRVAAECPVWAVGGITAETARHVGECGARGIAAIGAFIPNRPPPDIGRAVETLVHTLRFSFDRPRESS